MTLQPLESNLTPRRQPFLYLTAALLAGILIDGFAAPPSFVFIVGLIVSTIFSVIFISLSRSRSAALFLLAGFVAAGALLSYTQRNDRDHSRLTELFEQQRINAEDPVDLAGRLSLPPEPAPEAVYLDLDAETLRFRGEVIKATGRARLIVPLRDDQSRLDFERLQLDYGSRVRVLVRLTRARVFANPGSPDFNQFLELRGYDLKGTIKSPLLIERIGPDEANPFLAALYRLRLRCMKALDDHFNPTVAGTLKAMLMGNRYYLDERIEERLRESATFHILSISGMHVAIIAWALLGRWSPSKRRRAARVIASLLALWMYAVMVGLSPPVTRATLMITIGLVGPLLFRPSISINTVAFAAFAMLALKPALVADPGFQLSFVAVAAIVAIAVPVIAKLRNIGDWRITPDTPHPPRCSRVTRFLAEILFWDERAFRREMARAPFRYRLDKSSLARLLNRFYIQPLLRGIVVLIITSTAIQLATLPLSGFYFNRVAPIGILLNVFAGLLTAALMLSGIAAIMIGSISDSFATYITLFADTAHYLLVNQVAPFLNIPGATFRVAHYEGRLTIIYALFYIPLALLIFLIDKWQAVERMKPERKQTEKRRVEEWKSGRIGEQESSGSGSRGNQERVESKLRLPFPPSPIPPLSSFRRYFAPALCLIGLLVSTVTVVRPVTNIANGKLRVYFLDVGQGDAALIVFPQGKTMLVDGGGEPDYRNLTMREGSANGIYSLPGDDEEAEQIRDSGFSIGEMVVSRFLWSMGLGRIDYLLVTHPDVDHIQGLTSVARNFEVGQAIVARAPTDNQEFDRFVMSLTKNHAPAGFVRAGESFEIDGAQIEVLWPPAGSEQISSNDDSIVLRLVYGSTRILLTGDIERAAEAALVDSGYDLRADVIKAPHHGSRTSSSDVFLEAARPRFAVISAAQRNRFGHPHREVVERYQQRGITLFETKRDGMITVETDGISMNVRTYNLNKVILR